MKLIARLVVAFLIWGAGTTVIGFTGMLFAAEYVGHAAMALLLVAWLVGAVGFVVTAVHLVRSQPRVQ